MPVASDTMSPQLKLDGSVVTRDIELLKAMDVRLSLHQPDTATLQFQDPGLTLFDKGTFAVGKVLTVSLLDSGGRADVVFIGHITAVGVEDEPGGGASSNGSSAGSWAMIVTAATGAHRLATTSQFETYLKRSRADIVKAIAQRHGLKAKVEGATKVEAYFVQAGTDHAFLEELARGIGHEWFTHNGTLHFRPRPAKSGPELDHRDGSLVKFSATYAGNLVPSSLTVHGWGPDEKKAFQGEAGADLTSPSEKLLGSDAAFVAESAKKGRSTFGKPLVVGELPSRDAKEAEAIAKSLANELVGRGLVVRGTALGNPAIKAGGWVRIGHVGKKLSGSYYVTEVHHTFSPAQQVMTHFSSSGHRPQPAPWSPSGTGARSWATNGPVIGVVTNNNDKEGQGRVKVKFPSLDNMESDWARVVSPGAGKERGLDFRPEVDDEVLVVFEHGDPRFPLVLGGVWSNKSVLPEAGLVKDGKVTSRVIMSRLGHKVELSDGADAKDKHVTITTSDGQSTVELNEDGGITIQAPKDKPLVIRAGGASISISKKGDIKVDTPGTFTVSAKKDVKLSATGKVAVKGTSGTAIDGGPKLEVKSSAKATVQAGAMLELKGGMVKIN